MIFQSRYEARARSKLATAQWPVERQTPVRYGVAVLIIIAAAAFYCLF